MNATFKIAFLLFFLTIIAAESCLDERPFATDTSDLNLLSDGIEIQLEEINFANAQSNARNLQKDRSMEIKAYNLLLNLKHGSNIKIENDKNKILLDQGLTIHETQIKIDALNEVDKNLFNCLLYCPGIVLYSESCLDFKYDSIKAKLFSKLNSNLRNGVARTSVESAVEKNIFKCLSTKIDNNNVNSKDDPAITIDQLHDKKSSEPKTYRASRIFLKENNLTLKLNSIIKNISFVSTSFKVESTRIYFKDGSNFLTFEDDVISSGKIIEGKKIKTCSLKPIDHEFLINSGQCWLISKIKFVPSVELEVVLSPEYESERSSYVPVGETGDSQYLKDKEQINIKNGKLENLEIELKKTKCYLESKKANVPILFTF